MKFAIVYVFLIFTINSVYSQQKIDLGLNKVRIYESDLSILAEIHPIKSMGQIYTDRDYYWCSANEIHSTQGGFGGKLLNGTYIEYFPNKNLRVYGYYRNGLKNGVWKSWNSCGKLNAYVTWSNGHKNGRYMYYSESGNIQEQGVYHKDLLNGWIKYHRASGEPEYRYFNKGIEVKGKIKGKQLFFTSKKDSL
ncbi:toxin-antitoxin system YwqK family antitoxin [Daejeonella oryzae]|uniref:toxin-antitoxin system YwqK family antitoxin n=1 Tax=Daejeonella oryzae TaxID=1122943 RepID=UPI000406C5AB|nr:hypothetical protein [Daejeonella oryzae]